MKNKIELKKSIIISIFIIIIFNICFFMYYNYQYKKYTNTFNSKINGIVTKLKEKYPEVNENDIISLLNSNSQDTAVLQEYGIDINNDSAILENNNFFIEFTICNIALLSLFGLAMLISNLQYNRLKDKKLKEITKYIEEINKKNYKLDIDDNTEDELSILKNEIYKTTVMLKEQAENSTNDKVKLKDSLSDISHQLKTPLTSISILLDNILDNSNMDEKTRNDFIKDIKRETTNINFLVQAILKLSKLDSNTVEFLNKEEKIIDIINDSIKKVSPLCDLKNVQIKIEGDSNITIKCDKTWQIEAITNILKDSVEYSNENGEILIEFKENKIYSEIKIIDNGKRN